MFAVAREDPIGFPQGGDGEVTRLLADRLHIEAEAALSLEPHHAVIHDPHQHHLIEDALKCGVGDARHLGAGQRLTVVIEDATEIVFVLHG